MLNHIFSGIKTVNVCSLCVFLKNAGLFVLFFKLLPLFYLEKSGGDHRSGHQCLQADAQLSSVSSCRTACMKNEKLNVSKWSLSVKVKISRLHVGGDSILILKVGYRQFIDKQERRVEASGWWSSVPWVVTFSVAAVMFDGCYLKRRADRPTCVAVAISCHPVSVWVTHFISVTTADRSLCGGTFGSIRKIPVISQRRVCVY